MAGRKGDLTFGTVNREHHIERCTGRIVGTESPCDKKRVRLQKLASGDAHVCLNVGCSLYTNLPAMTMHGGTWTIAHPQ